MPGILPMKVIKVGGTNNQTRIAQACDRCRSKKIRCDGIRPSCTQCLNVGFECKTSDKLSRRAFPRGYTESLEERVRSLETEVRELKDLLDEKDEKIDLLARIHPHHSPKCAPPSRQLPRQSPVQTIESRDEPQETEEVFKVSQSPLLLEDDNRDSYFCGMSNGRTLVDAFKQRLQETGRPPIDVIPETFFHSGVKAAKLPSPISHSATKQHAPPRMVSDQLVNIFFQEWAPLFPVLHRPSFLELYTAYTSSPESITDKSALAQLNLVFGIAALSSPSRDTTEIRSFERQWQDSLESCLMENSLPAMQCFVLAQMYCMLDGDYSRLLKYKGLAVSLSHRLGLHLSQKRFALDALTVETRKKVFWSLYTIDCLSAAHLGLPKLLKEGEAQCEYPADVDDDFVTKKGFLPSQSGEMTKLSAGLALFEASRILAKVLDQHYPTSNTHEVSFRSIAGLSQELDTWYTSLPQHLRLHFAQDKPSTNVTGSRSPILSLFYHYTRSLIFRPGVCANVGEKTSSAILSVAQSAKSIVQILQLLRERSLSCSFPINKNELLVLSGFGLLFQTINADQEGKLMKDCQRMVCSVIDMLEKGSAPYAPAFRQLGCAIITAQQWKEMKYSPPLSLSTSSIHSMPAPTENTFRATQRHLKALASRLPSISRSTPDRRATVPQIAQQSNQSSVSLNSIRSEPSAHSEPIQSSNSGRTSLSNDHIRRDLPPRCNTNLDFLSFDRTPVPSNYNAANNILQLQQKQDLSSGDWERLLGALDNGTTNIYDTIYGGPPVDGLLDLPLSDTTWSPELWNSMSAVFTPEAMQVPGNAGPQSVLSFSDESLTSGEEFVTDLGSVGSAGETYGNGSGLLMPELSPATTKLESQFAL